MGIKIDKTEGGDFPVLDGPGAIECVLVDVVVPEQEGLYGPQLKWFFETAEIGETAEGDQVEEGLSLWAWSSFTYSEKSKTFEWAGILAGDDFDEDAGFDSSNLIGRYARVKFDIQDYKTKDGDERQRNKVTGLQATRKFTGQVLPATEAVTAPVEDEDIPF